MAVADGNDDLDCRHPIDTSRTVEVNKSWPQLIGVLAASAALSAVSLAILLNWVDEAPTGRLLFAGYLGLIAWPIAFLATLVLFVPMRRYVVSLSPQGLSDARLAPSMIPWSAIVDVNTVEYYKQKMIVLTLDQNIIGRLHRKIGSKVRRSGMFGTPKGLLIVSTGLAITFGELRELILAYHRDHGPRP
ncbi:MULTISPECIES: STM3941 family protein [unclassified Ensifer]|uniref:STM3941 family protein n=1 Tax=unclassified Ensifer TaxID=2633371 RepID=UPI0008137F9E|nr:MULTISPECIES: STM3941 family protein [unclassified Ensifer]OCP09448.1 hypothetical protein BC374_02485 [Ensifer sp. LC13]OCP10622.1 hypothetical protein BBX50_02830 [Ensifer sp. LC11]OCP11617.1 hypothetical protein BC362_06850 [Ensifer sp. LC14]OCP32696.1 hypothetical protein BC364_02485 [Ensifer sp. LC499]